MIKTNHKNKNGNTKGSALYFAILMVSVLLALALLTTSVAIKETQLAMFSRESQEAFYSADTGIECALYGDTIKHYGADPDTVFPKNSTTTLQEFDCLGHYFDPWNVNVESGVDAATTTFYIKFSDTDRDAPCVSVVVAKTDNDNDGFPRTTIKAFGVSASDKSLSNCDAFSSQTRRVERAIKVRYGDVDP